MLGDLLADKLTAVVSVKQSPREKLGRVFITVVRPTVPTPILPHTIIVITVRGAYCRVSPSPQPAPKRHCPLHASLLFAKLKKFQLFHTAK